ncbi:MAG: hypothetical protein HUK08_09705, partial [Bacteroidaceae bacterium]|nr:hypothetical protein [Bacteroidaceae bacterium]
MKKHSLLVAMSMALFGCASDIANGPIVPSEDGTKVEVTQPSVSQTFANGTTMKVYSPEETATGSRAANYTGGGIISNVKPDPLSEAKVKEYQETFMKEFPAGKKNLEADHTNLKDYSSDFAMISDGKPVTIYPISVGGNARNTLGIYYYDNDGNKIEQDLWALTEDNVIGTAKNGWTCLQSGDGITFTIPKGCRYGFYITNKHIHGTHGKGAGGRPLGNQPFYSESSLNFQNQLHAVT